MTSTIEAPRAETAGGTGGGNGAEWDSVAAMADGGREPTAAEVQAVINEAETITAEAAVVNEAEAIINGDQEKVGAINREKKDAWKTRQEAEMREAANKERRGKERMARGEMPKGRAPGESYDEWMEDIGEAGWVKKERARETFQKESAALEEWMSGGQMSKELYDAHPRKAKESDADYAKRIKTEITVGVCVVFRRESGESTEEWKARAIKEGEQPPKIKIAEEMKESEDAENFRELTNKNPREADESIKDYEARLSWLNEKQKEIDGEEQEVPLTDEGEEEINNGEEVGEIGGDGGEETNEEDGVEEDGGVKENNGAEENESDEEAIIGNLTGVAVEQGIDQLVKDEMEKMLETDLKKKGFIRKMLWGNMFREAYKEHSYREAATKAVWGRLDAKGLSEATERRFVTATVDGIESVIHGEVGERANLYRVEKNEEGKEVVYRVGRDAERNEIQELVDIEQVPEAKATLEVKQAIGDYASGRMQEGDFEEAMKRIQAEMIESGGDAKTLMAGNYLDVAKTAKEMYEHAESMDDVMDGFQMVYGKAMNEARTEVHRNAVDKVGDWLRGETGVAKRLRRVVPAELVVGAAELALVAMPGAAKKLGNAAMPILGGAVVNGLVNATKEGTRATEDRGTRARQLAIGETIGDTKYDREMQSAQYEMKTAISLTDSLKEAVESGDNEQLLALLVDAESRVRMSDQDKIDLISFSSGENVEEERFWLDVMIARAKVTLGANALEAESYTQAIQEATESLQRDRSAKDAAFRALKHKRMLAQGTKAAASTVVIGAAFQEALAFFRPDQYGLIEAATGAARPDGASDTMLAGAARAINVGSFKNAEALADLTGVSADRAEELTRQGYAMAGREVTKTVTETQTVNKPISVREFLNNSGAEQVHRLSWGANGTTWSDGNELGLWNNSSGNGFMTNMNGASTTWSGQTIDFNQAVSDGKISMLLSLTGDTQGTPIEIAGKVLDNGQVEFLSDDPAIQEIIANKSFKFAEVVYNAGTAADGAANVIPLATEMAAGLGSDTIMDTVTEEVTREVTETVFDAVNPDVVAAVGIPILGRKNLTLGNKPENDTEGVPKNGPISGPEETVTEETTEEAIGESTEEIAEGEVEGEADNETEVASEKEEGQNEKLEEPGEDEERSGEPVGLKIEPEIAQNENRINEYIEANYSGMIRTEGERARYREQLSAALRDWRRLTDEERQAVLANGQLPDHASGLLKRSFGDLRKLGYI